MILLFQPPMAEEAKETAGPGWRHTDRVTHLWEKTQHALILWLRLTEPPCGCAISWLLPSEPQNDVS